MAVNGCKSPLLATAVSIVERYFPLVDVLLNAKGN